MPPLFSTSADRRLLGIAPLSGPTPWVVAIMSFSIVIIAAAGLALADTAGLFTRSIESRYTVEVPAGTANLDRLVGAIRQVPDVVKADPVPESEMRQSLRRWLGSLATSRDLPVPSLVMVELKPGTSPSAVDRVARSFGAGITLEPQRTSVAPLLRALRALEWVALALVVLLASAAAAAIVLAARAALDTHRPTIEVLHGIGATDQQITGLFQRKITFDALVGSLAGAAAAGATLLILAAGSSFVGELTGGVRLGPVDLVLLGLLPLALTLLAALVTRASVLARLRQSL